MNQCRLELMSYAALMSAGKAPDSRLVRCLSYTEDELVASLGAVAAPVEALESSMLSPMETQVGAEQRHSGSKGASTAHIGYGMTK